jgi:hypothetical protein
VILVHRALLGHSVEVGSLVLEASKVNQEILSWIEKTLIVYMKVLLTNLMNQLCKVYG